MKIRKKDLNFSNICDTFIAFHYHAKLFKNFTCYSVYLGKVKIASVIPLKNDRFTLNDTKSTFKTFDGAIKGLLERLNGR